MEFTKSITVAELLQVKRLNLELVCGKRYILGQRQPPGVGA